MSITEFKKVAIVAPILAVGLTACSNGVENPDRNEEGVDLPLIVEEPITIVETPDTQVAEPVEIGMLPPTVNIYGQELQNGDSPTFYSAALGNDVYAAADPEGYYNFECFNYDDGTPHSTGADFTNGSLFGTINLGNQDAEIGHTFSNCTDLVLPNCQVGLLALGTNYSNDTFVVNPTHNENGGETDLRIEGLGGDIDTVIFNFGEFTDFQITTFSDVNHENLADTFAVVSYTHENGDQTVVEVGPCVEQFDFNGTTYHRDELGL